MKPICRIGQALLTLSIVLLAPTAPAQTAAQPVAQPAAQSLKVGVKTVPPFAMVDEAGQWSGISVDLWRQISDDLPLTFDWVPLETVADQITGLQDGRIDVAIGAITVTAEREQTVDFSNPFFDTGLGIATRSDSGGFMAGLRGLISAEFLSAVGILLAVLLVVGLLIWLLERRRNPEQFGGDPIHGIGNGFWWSAVTMTTVGYGDKAPATLGGRLLATVWMFISIITISGFTAAIATSFTVNQLQSAVNGIDDLTNTQTATIAGSSADEFLKSQGIKPTYLSSVEEGLTALTKETINAFVYDAPLMHYLLNNGNHKNIHVLPGLLTRQNYAFALRPALPQRETINQALLKIVQTESWEERENNYLGNH